MTLEFRIFLIAFSISALFYSIALIYLVERSSIPPHLSGSLIPIPFNISVYIKFATFFSAVGTYGSILNDAFTLSVFGYFLVLDTFLCFVPRFLLLYVFAGMRETLCNPHFLSPPGSSLPFTMPHGTFYSSSTSVPRVAEHITMVAAGPSDGGRGKCNIMFSSTVIVITFLLAIATAVQIFAVVGIRWYVKRLNQTSEPWKYETIRRAGFFSCEESPDPFIRSPRNSAESLLLDEEKIPC